MGRHLLLSLGALAVLTAGCGRDASSVVAAADGVGAAHAGLACARCHDGAALERGVAATSDRACLRCHQDGGARGVSLGAVPLMHRDHAGDSEPAAGCAACHTHRRPEEELAVTTTGCALCHASSLDGHEADGCRLCHTDPAHVATTSQGVPVMHTRLPWISGECVRCHFDVGRPGTAVAASTCVACHRNAAGVTEQGAGRDLHPSHTGVSCSACHAGAVHRIVAMSSGVRLQCMQCHATVHDLAAELDLEAAACNACHAGEHAAEQRLMLGAAPAGHAAAPGDKFLLGLTCRSCHVEDADGASTRTSCVGCHSAEYSTILTWWERGSAERVAQASRYVAASVAAAAGAAADSARFHAAAADSLLRFVREGGPAHNLPLSHRALESSLQRAAAAWTASGRSAPAPPDLGRMPRMGLCTYCHYTWREPRFQVDMPDTFHRRAMQRGRESAAHIGAETPP